MKRLMDMNLLHHLNKENSSKCPVCVEAKFSKRHFKSVQNRQSGLLELVNSDIVDFKNLVSRWGKNIILLL